MNIAIAVLLTIWTAYVSSAVNFSVKDGIFLVVWLAWPLYLTVILMHGHQKNANTRVWKFKTRTSHLLAAAFISLSIGLVAFNLSVSKIMTESGDLVQNSLFVGFFSVGLWFFCGISVFIAYLISKVTLKNSA